MRHRLAAFFTCCALILGFTIGNVSYAQASASFQVRPLSVAVVSSKKAPQDATNVTAWIAATAAVVAATAAAVQAVTAVTQQISPKSSSCIPLIAGRLAKTSYRAPSKVQLAVQTFDQGIATYDM